MKLIEQEWNEYRNQFFSGDDIAFEALKTARRLFYAGAVSVGAMLLLKGKEDSTIVQNFIEECNEWQSLAEEGLV